jgi:hypothetical protein
VLYKKTTDKKPEQVLDEIKKLAQKYHFVIRNIFDMNEIFSSHDINVNKKNQYYSVMLCNPVKAYKSIEANPDRAAVLLQPKQVVVYKKEKEYFTSITYLPFSRKFTKQALPYDLKFQEKLPQSCQKIKQLIDEITN